MKKNHTPEIYIYINRDDCIQLKGRYILETGKTYGLNCFEETPFVCHSTLHMSKRVIASFCVHSAVPQHITQTDSKDDTLT